MAFSIGTEIAFEFAVVEYPFALWQYGATGPDSIPDASDSLEDLFDHFTKVVPFYIYSDRGIRNLTPFFYQAFTELGYYGYEAPHLEDLLAVLPESDNAFFAPKDAVLTYRHEVMQDVNAWLEYHGNNIIYIYGDQDPWFASAPKPSKRTNALKIVKEGGTHSVTIRSLNDEDRERVLSTLEEWLEVEIDR
jgi:hypothetical protein